MDKKELITTENDGITQNGVAKFVSVFCDELLSPFIIYRLQESEIVLHPDIMLKCTKCGHIYYKNSKFCDYCEEPNPLIEIVECENCGKKIKNTSKYCKYCGNSRYERKCLSCGKQIKKDAKFCNFCGRETIIAKKFNN